LITAVVRRKRSPRRVVHSSSDEDQSSSHDSSNDDGDSSEDSSSEESDSSSEESEVTQRVVEKILAHKEVDGENKYFVKWKDLSYIHVSWVGPEEFQKERFGKAKIQRYHAKNEVLYDEIDEAFPACFTEVRVFFCWSFKFVFQCWN
jgi:hypothetical protein